MVVILLSTVAILILIMVYQWKYKRDVRGREMRIDMTQNVNTVDIETKANVSYNPIFCQILTEDNVAYGENRAGNGNYLAIIVSMEGNTQASVTQENEENYYDYID